MKTESITVVRGVVKDRLDPQNGAEQRFEIKKCVVIPRASNENRQGWVQVSGHTVVAPKGSDIRASDRVLIRGEVESVIGKPGDFGKKVIATTEQVTSINA